MLSSTTSHIKQADHQSAYTVLYYKTTTRNYTHPGSIKPCVLASLALALQVLGLCSLSMSQLLSSKQSTLGCGLWMNV